MLQEVLSKITSASTSNGKQSEREGCLVLVEISDNRIESDAPEEAVRVAHHSSEVFWDELCQTSNEEGDLHDGIVKRSMRRLEKENKVLYKL